MTTDPSTPCSSVTVRGTTLGPSDTPQQYRQKLARIIIDSMAEFVGLLDVHGTVLEINQGALDTGGVTVADVAGKPFWTTPWWQVSEQVRVTLCQSIRQAAQGEVVRWNTPIVGRTGSKEPLVADFSLTPVRNDSGAVVFLVVEGRDLKQDAANYLSDENSRRSSLFAGMPRKQTDRIRLLYADGDADMRAHVQGRLSGRFDVQTVCDGAEALDVARINPPDLILSEVIMPQFDGFSLLRAVRTDPALQDIPIILLSAQADEESRVVGLEAGADDYVVKPFGEREMIARIDARVKVARMRKEARAALKVSEEQFRTFADTAPSTLWITDAHGVCTFISRGWYEYTGQDKDVALGWGWLDAVHPDDRHLTTSTLLQATDGQQEFSLDYRLRRADGEYRWTLNSGRPRFDVDGRFAGLIGSVLDIHERKHAAEASLLLSAIVDSSDDAIISKNLNGIIMSWNKGAERLFGYTVEEAVGQPILMLIPPDRVEEEPKILDRLKRGERVDHFETIRVRKDGALLNISLTISPLKDNDGRIIGASKIARDITERVRQEQALREANAALKQANADLQQFAYSASHDLQEPLRMVAAYSQLLQKRFGGKLGPAGDQYIGYTVQGVMRLETLLRDLRTYTQVSATSPEPAEELDSGQVLKNTLLNLDVAIKESGASIVSTGLPRIRMHEFQLEQVFQNLIGNAIHYRSNLPPQIHVSAELKGGDWLFSVRDNGIGIESQFQEQIFGLFKRLHSAADYPGTGMGLAICQRIIERAGGRIWVESEPGIGSTFYFTVPCGRSRRSTSEPEDLFDTAGRGQPGGRGIGARGA